MIIELTEQGREPRRFEGWAVYITDGTREGTRIIEVKRGGVTTQYIFDIATTRVRFITDHDESDDERELWIGFPLDQGPALPVVLTPQNRRGVEASDDWKVRRYVPAPAPAGVEGDDGLFTAATCAFCGESVPDEDAASHDCEAPAPAGGEREDAQALARVHDALGRLAYERHAPAVQEGIDYVVRLVDAAVGGHRAPSPPDGDGRPHGVTDAGRVLATESVRGGRTEPREWVLRRTGPLTMTATVSTPGSLIPYGEDVPVREVVPAPTPAGGEGEHTHGIDPRDPGYRPAPAGGDD